MVGYISVLAACMMTFVGSISAQADAQSSSLPDWVKFQTNESVRRLLDNVSAGGTSPGSVIASPSRSNPNYYYHWVRDASLTMDVVTDFYDHSTDPVQKKHFKNLLQDYASFSARLQRTTNPSGTPQNGGLGEPKFNVDGTAYWEAWGRPQNDGPALRSLGLLRWARILVLEGQESWVRSNLFDPSGASSPIVNVDLEYVLSAWQQPSFDIWEESIGDHFYTRLAQARALQDGAAFAHQLGAQFLENRYQAGAQKIYQTLSNFWDSKSQIIQVTLNPTGGVNYKHSGLDTAVILAALHGGQDGQDWSVTDDRMISTLERQIEAFDGAYKINQNKTGSDGYELGVALGRYPEDKYNGWDTGGQGNPWFLVTFGVAEYAFRLAKAYSNQGSLIISPLNRDFFTRVTHGAVNFKKGQKIVKGTSDFDAVIDGLRSVALASIERAKYHTDSTGNLTEQFNRSSGYMQGAYDLTWSHASFLTMLRSVY